jgi:protein-disulfide isomerase
MMANKSGKFYSSPILLVVLAALLVAAALIAVSQLSAQRQQMALNPQPETQQQSEEQVQTGTETETPSEQTEGLQEQEEEQSQETTTGTALTWPPSEGSPDAPVKIIEFADFYCPFCARYLWETYPKIAADYIEKGFVRYEFRNLVVHGATALLAAVGGVCAQEQGRFWDFHNRFYEVVFKEGKRQVDESGLREIAADIGLNTASFNSCIQNYSQDFNKCLSDHQSCIDNGGDKNRCAEEFNECLSTNELAMTVLGDQEVLRSLIDQLPPDEQAQAQRIGTPTFFINGHILIGAQPYDNFKRLIDEALQEARGDGS